MFYQYLFSVLNIGFFGMLIQDHIIKINNIESISKSGLKPLVDDKTEKVHSCDLNCKTFHFIPLDVNFCI